MPPPEVIPDTIELTKARFPIDEGVRHFFAPMLDGREALDGPAKLFRPQRTFFPYTDFVDSEGRWTALIENDATGIEANVDAEDIQVIEV